MLRNPHYDRHCIRKCTCIRNMKEEISYEEENSGYLAIAGALSFGIIGGVGIPAFAATNTPAAEQATKTAKKGFR